MNPQIPLLVIVGPTASGKTALAVQLAKKFNGEIINADSMQIYKEMSIGSAKPTLQEQEGIPHHLIDIVSVAESFTVSQYEKLATKSIFDVYNRGKTPIVCGGTGLYIRSILYDMSFSNSNLDTSIREELQQYVDKNGKDALHLLLVEIDEVAAQKLHPNDVKRVIRAIEVYRLTGIPFSKQGNTGKYQKRDRYNSLIIGLRWPREILVDRIKKRIDIMVDNGLISEAKNIYDMQLPRDLPSMQGLGYKQLFEFFDGHCTLDHALEQTFIQTRQFAKRQMTWFRNQEPATHWLPADSEDIQSLAEDLIQNHLLYAHFQKEDQ